MQARAPLQIAMEVNKIAKNKQRQAELGYVNRRSSVVSEFIVWALLRPLNLQGRALPVERAISYLENSGRSESRLREIIMNTSGLFFDVTKKKRTGEWMINRRSAEKVIADMGVSLDTSAEGYIELPDQDTTARTMFSLLYRSWIIYRARKGKGSFIISRKSLADQWGVSITTIQRWEKIAKICVEANFATAHTKPGDNNAIANYHIPNNRNGDGAVFIRNGVLYWRLPNTYWADDTIETPKTQNAPIDEHDEYINMLEGSGLPEHAKTKTHKRTSGDAVIAQVLPKVTYARNQTLKRRLKEIISRNRLPWSGATNTQDFPTVFVGKQTTNPVTSNKLFAANLLAKRSFYQRQDGKFWYRSRYRLADLSGSVWELILPAKEV